MRRCAAVWLEWALADSLNVGGCVVPCYCLGSVFGRMDGIAAENWAA